MEHYSYIFVRQDLSKEQQLVQFGHVACVMGKNLPDHICPKSLNFVAIGVKNEIELFFLEEKLVEAQVDYHVFQEPDINNEITALATMPVQGSVRDIFKKYNTLRF